MNEKFSLIVDTLINKTINNSIKWITSSEYAYVGSSNEFNYVVIGNKNGILLFAILTKKDNKNIQTYNRATLEKDAIIFGKCEKLFQLIIKQTGGIIDPLDNVLNDLKK